MHFARNITRIRVRIAALALGLALTAAVLAACGSDDNSSGGSSASTSTPAKSTSTAAPAKEASAGVTDYVKYLGGKAGAADTSKSPIIIGYVNQQGGANDVGPNSTIGAQLAADYANKYAGGIDGHPVKLHTCFISTSEEQGQQCGQKMANDKAVDAVGVGAVATGAQPLNASIAGEKPMFWGVSGQPGRHEEQGRLHPLRRLVPHSGSVGDLRARRAEGQDGRGRLPAGAGHHRGRQRDGGGPGEGGHQGQARRL